MTAVTLNVKGTQKENVKAIWFMSVDGQHAFGWGENESVPLNGTIQIPSGDYHVFYQGAQGKPVSGPEIVILGQLELTIDIDADD